MLTQKDVLLSDMKQLLSKLKTWSEIHCNMFSHLDNVFLKVYFNCFNIVFCFLDHASGNQPLVDECVETIMRYALSSHGKLNSVAIPSFLSLKIQNEILSILKTKPIALR